jgi:hypothetical protein
MLKKKKIVWVVSVTVLWLAVMAALLQREYFAGSGKEIKADYQSTLKGLKEEKHSRLSLYYGPQRTKIGELQTIIQPQEDGTFEISNRTHLSFDLHDPMLVEQLHQMFGGHGDMQGENFAAGLQTKARIGPDYQIKEISFQVQSNFLNLAYEGQVKGNRLMLDMEHHGKHEKHEMALPPGTMVSDNLGSLGQFPKLAVGKQIHMRCFDPISRTYRLATSQVVSQENFRWDNRTIPVFVVHTTFGPFKSTAWVTEDGEVMQYQILSFTLVREPVRSQAKPQDQPATQKGQ